MKILLINPPLRQENIPHDFPIGLGYIASSLMHSGYKNITVLDIYAERLSKQEVNIRLNELLQEKVDIIGIGGLITTYKYIKWLVNHIRTNLKFNNIIVLGGGLATSESSILFEELKIDYAVLGEGEKTIVELVKAIEGKKNLDSVDGICYKSGNKLMYAKPAKPIKEIDSLPFPAWDLFPIGQYLKNYYHAQLKEKPNNEMVIFTSRGCPYSCNFCYHIFGYKYRYRSVQSIINEIEMLISKYGAPMHIRFIDDCFVINKERLIEFCNRLVEIKLDITWSCMGRVNILTKELLKLMKRAGCLYVGYGLESGSQGILDRMRKQATVEQNIKIVNTTLNLGLSSCPTIMTNQPGENAETVRDTVEMIRKIGISNSRLFYACPYPGTPLFEYASKSGLLKKFNRKKFLEMISDTDVDKLIVNFTSLSDEDLIKLHDKAEAEIGKVNKKLTFIKIYRLYRRWGMKKFLKKALTKLKSKFSNTLLVINTYISLVV